MKTNFSRRNFISALTLLGLISTLPFDALSQAIKKIKFKGEFSGELLNFLEQTFQKFLVDKSTVGEVQAQLLMVNSIQEYCRSYIHSDLFQSWMDELSQENDRKQLFKGKLDKLGFPGGKIKGQLFFLDEGYAEPPHAHHNLISSQYILTGGLEVKTYDRIKRFDEKSLIYKPTQELSATEGEGFTMTEFKENIHWFKANNGPTAILNINIQGFFTETFEDPSRLKGRYYLDMDKSEKFGHDSYIVSEINEEEAYARYHF